MVEIAKTEKDPDLRLRRSPESRRHGRERRPATRWSRSTQPRRIRPSAGPVINSLFTSGQRHRARRPRPQRAGHGDEDGDRASGCRTWTTKRRRRLHARAAEVGAGHAECLPHRRKRARCRRTAATSLAVGVVIAAQQPRITNGQGEHPASRVGVRAIVPIDGRRPRPSVAGSATPCRSSTANE